ncbi:MAG: class I SAM-dependent methyltransferase [Maribacter sp.]|nr:class I SAM-dependent methyltransferase [Maribacter sp.]
MNKNLLNTGIQEYILKINDADIMSVLLKKPLFTAVTNKEIVEQVIARNKCRTKLPTWYQTSNIYYPNKRSLEQTSSEITARYKAEIIHGNSLADLTGGFGVDAYFFSLKFENVVHCEIDKGLSEITSYNFKILGRNNITCLAVDGMAFLKATETHFDWIYVDPSRRHDHKGKVFRLEDCTPNVPEHIELLFQKSKNILLKTSPLLDFAAGIDALRHVKQIYVVAVNNDVKELLWVMEKDFADDVEIKTIHFKKSIREYFGFNRSEEANAVATYALPLAYLYEPNAAIMKSGAFKSVAKYYNLAKLHEHTHLYTANELIDFPGRRFRIEGVFSYKGDEFRHLGIRKANITTRNFKDSVAGIRKKFKISEGGDIYLFFCLTMKGTSAVIQCSQL